MFTFSSARAAMWMLVVLLMVATGFVACDVAIAADLTAAPDVKNSQPEPQRARSRDAIFIPIGPQPPVPTTLKIKPDKQRLRPGHRPPDERAADDKGQQQLEVSFDRFYKYRCCASFLDSNRRMLRRPAGSRQFMQR